MAGRRKQYCGSVQGDNYCCKDIGNGIKDEEIVKISRENVEIRE